MYSMAAFKDPGFVKTNIFKAETENSVIHTQEIQAESKKLRRIKFTRPPSTVQQELEKENKLLELQFNKQQNNNNNRNLNKDQSEMAFEVSQDQLQRSGHMIDESLDDNYDSNRNLDQEEEDKDEEDENQQQFEIKEDVVRVTSQVIEVEANIPKHTQILQQAFHTDEDSNLSQIARDFFMQTQGDKGGSFDLLQDEIKEEDESNESFDNKSSISHTHANFNIEAAKRLNTDYDIYRKNHTKLLDEHQQLISPQSAKIILGSKNNNKFKKQAKDQSKVAKRVNNKHLLKRQFENMKSDEDCIVPGSSGNKGSGMETDVPDLERKLMQQPKIKLVLNLPSSSTISSQKNQQLMSQQAFKLHENKFNHKKTPQIPRKVLNESQANIQEAIYASKFGPSKNQYESQSSGITPNVPVQTGDDFTIDIKDILLQQNKQMQAHQTNESSSGPVQEQNNNISQLINQLKQGRMNKQKGSSLQMRQPKLKSSLKINLSQQSSNRRQQQKHTDISSTHFGNKQELKRLSPKPMPSLFTYQEDEDDNYVVQVLNTRQLRQEYQNQSRSDRRINTFERMKYPQSDGRIQIELRYCTVCNMEQPLRSKHCRGCDKCVSTYDHHCPWLGNCIGERNRKFFYIYLWQQQFQLIAALLISINLIKRDLNVVLGIVSLIIESIFILFVTYLLSFHTYLAFTNTTTWECLSWKKISYLKEWPRKLGSPFNIGTRNNLRLYFCYNLGKENYFVWRMPKRKPDLEKL